MKELSNVITTEEFHQLLADNTKRQNELRLKRSRQLAGLHKAYNIELDDIMECERSATAALRKLRNEFDKAKADYELTMRQYAKDRNSAGYKYNQAKATIISNFAAKNEELQAERHDIFERFRNSGGNIVGDLAPLLHPDWEKPDKTPHKLDATDGNIELIADEVDKV